MKTRTWVMLSFAALGILAGPVAPVAWAQAAPQERIVVKTADDLPRFTYKIEGKTLDIINDHAKVMALLELMLADGNSVLDKYQIDDAATLKGIYDQMTQAYVLKGDYAKALEFVEKARALETKEQEKLMRGVSLKAMMKAKAASGGDDAVFARVFKTELYDAVAAMPFEPIKDRLIAVRNTSKIISRELVEQSVSTSLDPMIENNKGTVPMEVAAGLVQAHYTLTEGMKLIPLMADVYGKILDANGDAKSSADLWTPRLVTLAADEAGAVPVAVGIWDSGVDTTLYANQLWTNPSETLNGKDDDANGYVDDIHGIAFSLDRYPTTGPLAKLDGLIGNKDQLVGFIVASQDMQAGIETPEVEAFRNHYKNLKGEDLKNFMQDLGLLGSWSHGTHVAGVAVAGNPFARIVHITENWPYKAIPDEAPTVELGKRWGMTCEESVAYLKKANVRVVNMSWRVGRAAFEGMLEAKGVGANPAERAELSRQIFAGLRDGLEKAIASAPEILFIAGSGNEDNDVDFAEYVPAGLRLPNLITVGAVDQRDKFTDFTTTGKNVELYANGYRIDSYIPGGQLVKFSGTSMAAPQVANLAAKMLAINPKLTPAEVVQFIRDNADPIEDQPGRFIINPKRTVEATRMSR